MLTRQFTSRLIILTCAAILLAAAPSAGASGFTCTDPDSLYHYDSFDSVTSPELSLAVNPTNPDHIVMAAQGGHVYVTSNGGTSWTYHPVSGVGSDPTVAIDSLGRMHLAYNGFVAFCDYNNGNPTSWTCDNDFPIDDKPHICVDPLSNIAHLTWVKTDTFPSKIMVARSVDRGVNWIINDTSISEGVDAQIQNHGPNIQVGPDSSVYVVWSIYDNAPPYPGMAGDESGLGFARSTNGGATWETAWRLPVDVQGTRGSWFYRWDTTLATKQKPSFPSMTVDQRSGTIYVAWTNMSDSTTLTTDILLTRSSSEGDSTSWSTPAKINREEDYGVNDSHQWLPWLSCDPETGWLSCFFYDNREFFSDTSDPLINRGRPYVAFSFNRGSSWQDCPIGPSVTDDGDATMAPWHPPEYMGHVFIDHKSYTAWNSADYWSQYPCTNGNVQANFTTYEIDTADCCSGMRGNFDNDAADVVDISDLTELAAYVYSNGPDPFCMWEADVNGDGSVDTTDVDDLIDYLFVCYSNCPPDSCPEGSSKTIAEALDSRPQLPEGFELEQNYPNPFNPTTTFAFSIPTSGHVTLEVMDILGRRVAVLVDGVREAGHHTVDFDASKLASGVYLYRLEAGGSVDARKMILLK